MVKYAQMTSKYAILVLAMGLSGAAMAQEVDDMYFNAKDRLALSESNQAVLAARYQDRDQQAVNSNPVNPSDSYSGRGVNPEYNAQQKNGTTVVQDNPDYFLTSYQATTVNSNLYSGGGDWYSSCHCGTGSPYGMGYGGFGNPYGNYYSPYGGYNGLTTSLGYGFGSYGSGWSMAMSYGMGSMYGSPYYGGYSPYGYNPYGYSNYGYPSGAVVVTGADSGIGQAHGRRPTRTGSLNNNYVGGANDVAGTNGRGRITTGTRTSQSNYYNPGWRSDPGNFQSRNYGYGGGTNYPGSGTTGRSLNSNSGRTTRSYFDSYGTSPRGTSSFGSPSGGSSSGSSGGRSRGRN
jgi:hypothetical protein